MSLTMEEEDQRERVKEVERDWQVRLKERQVHKQTNAS